jgi:hypothetical protein
MNEILNKSLPSIILEFSPVLYKDIYTEKEVENFLYQFFSLGYGIYHIIEDEKSLEYFLQISKENVPDYVRSYDQTNILITKENITVIEESLKINRLY